MIKFWNIFVIIFVFGSSLMVLLFFNTESRIISQSDLKSVDGLSMILPYTQDPSPTPTIEHERLSPSSEESTIREQTILSSTLGIELTNLNILKSIEEPFFYLVSSHDEFPRADGDTAQRRIVEDIGLREKCKQDPSTIVVDIGGYLGDFGLSAAAMGCKVYIFEPTPFQYWLINASIALNGFQNNCFAFNYAISSTESVLKFRQAAGQTNQVPLLDTDDISNPENGTFYIHSIPLDTILPTEKIFLMKVDVEGFEPTVLFGGSKKILEEHRVDHLITEYTPWWVEDGKGPWEDFLPKLKKVAGDKATMFALHRSDRGVYGPIREKDYEGFWIGHFIVFLQTDVYVDFTGQFEPDMEWGDWSIEA